MNQRKARFLENFLFLNKVRLWKSRKIGRYKSERIVKLLKIVSENYMQGNICANSWH